MDEGNAAARLLASIGVPDCVAKVELSSDKHGPYLVVRLAPGYPGKVSVPSKFQGFPVLLKQ